MLLTNNSKLHFYVEVNLTFDDDSSKNTVVNVGDTIHLVFRHNGIKLDRQGTVKSIYPSRIVESQLYGAKKLSAVLELDCSSDYKSTMYRVDISDILDILPVLGEEEANDTNDVWNDLSDLLGPEEE